MRDGSPELKCYRCGETKPEAEFAWRRKARGQRDSFCRPCRAAYKREHYLRNKQRYIDNAGQRRRAMAIERMQYLLEFFADHPCVDCGETDPIVLEFDHLRDKRFTIGRAVLSHNWQSVREEMDKCEAVCANCHRRRTSARLGSVKATLIAVNQAGAGN